MKVINNLTNISSPVHKLKAILSLGGLINDNVGKHFERKSKKDFPDINSFELFSLFVYIISKAAEPALITHCNLIEKFVSDESLSMFNGYSYYTFRACVDYFAELSI